MHNRDTSNIQNLLSESKKKISLFLTEYLQETSVAMQEASVLAQDLPDYLLPFCLRGKMIRGSLVLYMHTFLQGGAKKNAITDRHVIQTAAALELVQAALLMHDDIMDGDTLRRGKPTMHIQYEQRFLQQRKGKQKKSNQIISQLGPSLAICLGDESLFLAMDLIARLPNSFAGSVMRCIAPQLVKTGLGQSQDVINASQDEVDKEAILSMYRNKTALYTFTIPLCAGALLAGKQKKYLEKIEQIGTDLGLLYQLRDDYLGVCGNPDQMGKHTLSDITENKKTVLRLYIFEQAKKDDKIAWVQSLFGNKNISDADQQKLRSYIFKSGIKAQVDSELDFYYQAILSQIKNLELSQQGSGFFTELATYLRYREF